MSVCVGCRFVSNRTASFWHILVYSFVVNVLKLIATSADNTCNNLDSCNAHKNVEFILLLIYASPGCVGARARAWYSHFSLVEIQYH